MRLDYQGDENERNNRYEMALNALMLRPVYKHDDEVNTLAYRAPTTSRRSRIEGIHNKKARRRGAVHVGEVAHLQRRRCFAESDVRRLQARGTAQDWPCRDLDWSYYEGPRDLQKWIGLWGDFERFNPWDGGAELHETGHISSPHWRPVSLLRDAFVHPGSQNG